MRYRYLLPLFIGISSVIVFITYPPHQYPQPTVTASPSPMPILEPVNEGNGVYYFEATGEQYQKSLSKFYENNPGKHCVLQGLTDKKVEAWSGDSRTAYSRISGFILYCQDDAIDAQSETVP